MIVYIVQICLDPKIEADWIAWMKDKHLADVIGTKCFDDHRFFKVQQPHDPRGWPMYQVHYRTDSKARIDQYIAQFAPALRQDVMARYPNQFIATRWILEEM